MHEASGSAHAKSILFGEHAVVYGAPAVAIPLRSLEARATVRHHAHGVHLDSDLFSGAAADAPQRVQPVLAAIDSALERTGLGGTGVDVRLSSTIPYERGLGSSAAVGVAIARGIANYAGVPLRPDEIHDVSMDAELIAHGGSSGLDGHTVASPTPIYFHGEGPRPLRVGAPLHFVLADTGHPGSTAEAVGSVRLRLREAPLAVGAHIDRLGEIAERSLTGLAAGDIPALGALMTRAQQHLGELGVSDPSIEQLVAAADDAGAAGAKLTGSGRGGCVIALAHTREHADALATALRAAGAVRTWQTTVEAA